MKRLFIFLFPVFHLVCREGRRPAQPSNGNRDSTTSADTVVSSREITNEMAGAAYRKRARSYFVVTGKDSSGFACTLTESKEGNKVGIHLRFIKTMTYRQQMNELSRILPQAAKDFTFDSLRSVSVGRLIATGDLAVAISNQYIQEFGPGNKLSDYKEIASFLLRSQLASGFNEMLKPYSLSVDRISVEKVFFANIKTLYRVSRIETDAALIPENILDCITWISLKKTGMPG